jgi:hypothetical protein
MRILRLRCPCGRNLADVVQDPREAANPRGYNGYTYRGLMISPRPGVEGQHRAHGVDDPSPDRTDTFTCPQCRSPRTGGPTVHTLSGRLIAQLWDANVNHTSGVVRVTIEYR